MNCTHFQSNICIILFFDYSIKLSYQMSLNSLKGHIFGPHFVASGLLPGQTIPSGGHHETWPGFRVLFHRFQHKQRSTTRSSGWTPIRQCSTASAHMKDGANVTIACTAVHHWCLWGTAELITSNGVTIEEEDKCIWTRNWSDVLAVFNFIFEEWF